MEIKFNLFNRSKHHLWGLVLGISVAILLFTLQNGYAAPRQCVCHTPPDCDFDVCSAGFDDGHLNHEDPQGMCNSCGNGKLECCTPPSNLECLDNSEIECCDLTQNTVEGCQIQVPGCIPEECDDGDNDCRTNDCDANCHLSNCDPGVPCCNDGEDCTTDTCITEGKDAGVCISEPRPDDADCEEGDLCTVDDKCEGGVCMDGPPKNCDDNLPDCAVPICEAGQCLVDLSGCPCENDAQCNDNNDCTTDICGDDLMCDNNPVPEGSECNDGNPDTTDDHCEGVVCVSCGNMQKDNSEECDGADFAQCTDNLGCNNDCSCRVHICGDGDKTGTEECDTAQGSEDQCPAGQHCLGNSCNCIDDAGQIPEPCPSSLQGSGLGDNNSTDCGGCSLTLSNVSSQGWYYLILMALISGSIILWRVQAKKKVR